MATTDAQNLRPAENNMRDSGISARQPTRPGHLTGYPMMGSWWQEPAWITQLPTELAGGPGKARS
ncbi:uncharacterized protein SCHCODRAFT_01039281 [Schizophyllum commune H4-8]|uniref:uncharacterized protein n=1 Tax=Schizophyllum commune (strain H4-8 / FGSC 9210) TaxID=578458 RepID=UPI00215DE667|nr:uncharacterized protein SCHCODRAFT_01039281 [Schizophyllum commune H4-8]KAI5888701.1 hypothetical protein SCHCODRAFT_01039281 [Schizophyllum commune H4-8]